ncbi:MAG: SMC-Scp complex subunit ScpB [Gammaproteobacteria bacterium]|jgi:segregation and condensation protein B
MDENAIKNVLEAALLAANASVSLDKLAELFSARGADVDRAVIKGAISALAEDYSSREIEVKETASGFRIQVKSSVRDWLQPLFEERAPRYTRALLETLALIAYRQPITRAEIEEVRGVAVSTNIVRTLIERGWIRVVGHRDVPGKPSMLGTTKEFLDYFGLKRLDDLPPLAELREMGPENDPQSDFVDELAAVMEQAGESSVHEASEEEASDEEASVDDASEENDEPAPNVIPIHQSEG